MLLVGVKNTGAQTVLSGGVINIGTVYRKFCKRNRCGNPAFSITSNGVTLNTEGIYHITATFVGSGSAAGALSVQLALNGSVIDGAISTETITTADTEIRTWIIDYYAKVDTNCVLGIASTESQTASFVNSSDGIDATFTSVVLNIDKVV